LENFEMKKTLIALAALAATGAFAQSSVTLYGAVDASFEHDAGAGLTVNKLNNSNLGSSKLGFKGTEDLGGGLSAVFKLEGGLKNESGNGKSSNTNNQASGAQAAAANGAQGLDFQRYSYVGLAGNFGEVHLGREYIYSFWYGTGVVDPFSTNGPADVTHLFYKLSTSVSTNASNMISYTSPNGPVQGGAQYFLGGNTAATGTGSTAVGKNDGSGYSAFLKYQQGPLLVSGAISKTTYLVAGDYKVSALAAQYDLTSAASLMYTYGKETQLSNANTSNMIAGQYTMGAVTWKASFTHANRTGAAVGTANQYGLGVHYLLSKRTKLYTTVAEDRNSGSGLFSTGSVGAAKDSKSGALAIGVYHSF
jgi:predicted porin